MSDTFRFRGGDRIVVTGGAGFLGSTLVGLLLQRGCRVTVIDDFSGGSISNLPADHDGLSIARLTLGASAETAGIDREVARADAVVHLASPIGVQRAHEERFAVVSSILGAGMAVVAACQRYRRPLLFTSSSEVYGAGHDRPIPEADPFVTDIRPRWGYAVGKAAVEHLVAGLFLEHRIPAWIVRPFNMAGPRQRPATGLVIPTFVAAALSGRPLIVHDDGSQARAFLHVEDAAAALILILQCEALRGVPVNLGGTESIRIGNLARMVIAMTKSTSQIENRPSKALFGEDFAVARERIPDISLLRSLTGWQPTRTTQETIADCVEYLRGDRAAA